MHDAFLSLFIPSAFFGADINSKTYIFSEPITQILGVPEGDVAGEIFINQGSTINITCIGIASRLGISLVLIFTFHLSTVRNLPEKSSMYWTHNNEVRRVAVMFYELADGEEGKYFVSKHKSLLFVCSVPVGRSAVGEVNL